MRIVALQAITIDGLLFLQGQEIPPDVWLPHCQLNGPRVKPTPGMAGFAQAAVAAVHSLKERSRSNR